MSIDNCIDSSFNDFLCTAKYQYLSFLYLSIIIKTFYISGYRSSESSSVKNCLTDEALLYDAAEFNQNIGTHPGQLTHPNEQCKATVGPRSYYGWVSPMYLICLFLLSKKGEQYWWESMMDCFAGWRFKNVWGYLYFDGLQHRGRRIIVCIWNSVQWNFLWGQKGNTRVTDLLFSSVFNERHWIVLRLKLWWSNYVYEPMNYWNVIWLYICLSVV